MDMSCIIFLFCSIHAKLLFVYDLSSHQMKHDCMQCDAVNKTYAQI